MAPSSDASVVSAARPSWPSRCGLSSSGLSVLAGHVGRGGDAQGGTARDEERRLLAVAERQRKIDELRQQPGSSRLGAELLARANGRRADERRGGRARRRSTELEPGPGAPCEPVEGDARRRPARREVTSWRTAVRPRAPHAPASDDRNTSVCAGSRRRARVPVAAYPRRSSIRAAVPDALSLAPPLAPLLSLWATTMMVSSLVPGTTVTRLTRSVSPSPGTSSRQRSGVDGQAVQREPLLVPPGRPSCAHRARDAVRIVTRELRRELESGRGAEGRRQRGRR